MKKKKITFLKVYLVYIIILAAAVIASVSYVNKVMHQYENFRPEKCVEDAFVVLKDDIENGVFWEKYSLPEVKAGEYEKQIDVQSKYAELFLEEDVDIAQKGGADEEDELFYEVKNGGVVLAEVKLKAMGPAVTKLAVFNIREWNVEYVKPVLETYEYTVSVPADFCVSVNDIALTAAAGKLNDNKEITYTIENVYLEPDFMITNAEGSSVDYTVKNYQVMAEYYNYSLILPESLTVEVNGEKAQGTDVGDDHLAYDIILLEKPEVTIKDCYGNTVNYEGGSEFPLTYKNIKADSRYTVKVSGSLVPDEVVTTAENEEYEPLADYVDDLPKINLYNIAVLENEAEISVTDEKGNPLTFDKEETQLDLTAQMNALDTVPDSVSAEIDVLDVAQKWSMFLTKDLPFSEMKEYMVEDSYQYNVARQYATGIDITFTSSHTLDNPPFTDVSVSNFVWITDDCFSIDISFVKHMILKKGGKVDDPMNDRFTFVKYDDSDNGIDDPAWKLISMKEIVSNE